MARPARNRDALSLALNNGKSVWEDGKAMIYYDSDGRKQFIKKAQSIYKYAFQCRRAMENLIPWAKEKMNGPGYDALFFNRDPQIYPAEEADIEKWIRAHHQRQDLQRMQRFRVPLIRAPPPPPHFQLMPPQPQVQQLQVQQLQVQQPQAQQPQVQQPQIQQPQVQQPQVQNPVILPTTDANTNTNNVNNAIKRRDLTDSEGDEEDDEEPVANPPIQVEAPDDDGGDDDGDGSSSSEPDSPDDPYNLEQHLVNLADWFKCWERNFRHVLRDANRVGDVPYPPSWLRNLVGQY
ncbi:hypothetical protein TWF481_011864 [Arthrobotrys musiformis]|uniref:Uncharacterized protein n=1 Tax=Arthrobotrys musiformis TaxID=47236 RepID=A0AAV9VY61_9PEZI